MGRKIALPQHMPALGATFELGKAAFTLGTPIIANPSSFATEKGEAWAAGWVDACIRTGQYPNLYGVHPDDP
jgi:hypothetical protein